MCTQCNIRPKINNNEFHSSIPLTFLAPKFSFLNGDFVCIDFFFINDNIKQNEITEERCAKFDYYNKI